MHRFSQPPYPALTAAVLFTLTSLAAIVVAARWFNPGDPGASAGIANNLTRLSGAIGLSGSPPVAAEAVDLAGGPEVPPLVPPLLVPDDPPIGKPAISFPFASDQPLAYLDPPPVELNVAPMVGFPAAPDWDFSTEVGFRILSIVRYTGPEHSAVLTVAEPSPAAARLGYEFGPDSAATADGGKRWIVSDYPDDLPNAVVTRRDHLLITLASDLPIDLVEEIADTIRLQDSRSVSSAPAR